jgi:L-rhamnose mutarotase
VLADDGTRLDVSEPVAAESGGALMKQVLTVDLRDDPGVIEAYTELHRRVWPEVLRSLRRTGIADMDIYLLERRLVMVVETNGRDVKDCFARHIASHPRVAQWEALMKSMQEPPPGGEPGEWWTVMRPVFRLNGSERVSPEPEPESARRA